MTVTYLTFEQAQQVVRTIAEDEVHGGKVIYPQLRALTASRLAETWPEDEGMGTSDVSIALIEDVQFFEVPHIGPIIKAYEACGFTVPAFVTYTEAFTE